MPAGAQLIRDLDAAAPALVDRLRDRRRVGPGAGRCCATSSRLGSTSALLVAAALCIALDAEATKR